MHIEHVAMWVRNLETMRTFYETYFGATANDKYSNLRKGFSSYFLTFPGGCARLELMLMPGIIDLASDGLSQYLGLTHLAMSVGSQETVDTLTERLRRDGYTIAGEPRLTGDGYYESIVLDPENNRIEITV
ncbi:VOC family protein [Spirosoma aerolatum]|uniref:VOC family protein n=1 Tax=Spirosoma aerolatum TaxID=1211326 RepID=UPI0009AC362A|nr:VOC family protein [Spirosoma aerolatum]